MESPMDAPAAGPLTGVQLVILLQIRIIYNIFPETSYRKHAPNCQIP